MNRYVAIALLLMISLDHNSSAPSPLQLTVDCDCDDDVINAFEQALPRAVKNGRFIIEKIHPHDMEKSASDSLLHDFLPDDDDTPTLEPKLQKLTPPEAPKLPSLFNLGRLFSDEDVRHKPGPKFKPYRFRPPKVRTPHFQVPKLKPAQDRSVKPPTLGSAIVMPFPRKPFLRDEETSAERLEIIKKGVQKMMKFVKVLGQIDQYISDRTRIVIDKLSKTFVED